jgi:hypothetical protein
MLISTERNEKQFIKLPRNITDAKNLGVLMKKYKEDNGLSVFIAFMSTYIL